MARKRSFNVFSLSFLDVMSCGFGAVVLIYLIINHATEEEARVVNKDLLSEIRMLDYQVQNGERDLFELKERLDALLQRLSDSSQKLVSSESSLEDTLTDFADLAADSLAEEESLEALKSDVETREEELARLKAINEANEGGRIRAVSGEGDRQYLTGLKVGGKHVLIAVDTSASMLDETIVNVIRRRNMPEQRRRMSPKWQRAVRTVEWLTAQLPLDANFQIVGFNVQPTSLVPDQGNAWVPLGEGRELDDALQALKKVIPENGTSLANLITTINEMIPAPDNVYLIIDSLPTQGTREPRRPTITGRDRLQLFAEAIRQLPKQVPINVIMFPMEGDPMAAAAYWNLARVSGGAFLSPSRDWP
jgi:hypothetical protein